MRVQVSDKYCQGHAMCNAVAPELFELDDVFGHAHTLTPEVPSELKEAARKAAASCPEQAIMIEDEEE